VDPDAGCTRTDHGHGAGDGLFRHYEGLYAVLDEFRENHPELVLEACSSGGLRLDLGLAKHVHTLFLSDPDYTEHALQVFWGAGMMLPPASILHWSWSQWRGDYPPSRLDFGSLTRDEFATTLRAALLHRFGVSLRLPGLRDDLAEVLAEHVGFYTSTVAPLVRDGVVRRLSGQPERGGRGERLPAFQLSSTDARSHVLTAFRLTEADPTAVSAGRVTPRALDADADYRVTDPFGAGAPAIVAGAELMSEGLPAPTSDGRMASWVRVIERV
jgi:alpha-galactosidase